MKCRVLGTTLLFLLAASVYGQPYDIPFAFHVGEKNFAAGRYHVSDDGPLTALRIKTDSGQGVMVLPHPGRQAESMRSRGTLVFHRYADAYFLSEVWRPGSDVGEALPKSKAEREIAKSVASTQATAVYASMR
jgi:hypothetical protein